MNCCVANSVGKASAYCCSNRNSTAGRSAKSPKLAPRGKYALIPARLHQPIEAYAVVIDRAEDVKLAREFLAYCLSPEARPIWRRFGFNAGP